MLQTALIATQQAPPQSAPPDLSQARVLAAIIAFVVAILLALMILLLLRWAASRVARGRTEGGKRTPSPTTQPWAEAGSRIAVEETGLTGEGGSGPKLIDDPPPSERDVPNQFDVFDPDEGDDDGSLDETAGEDPSAPGDTGEFDIEDDDPDEPDDWVDDDNDDDRRPA